MTIHNIALNLGSNITASGQDSRVSLNANEAITHSGNIEVNDGGQIDFFDTNNITLETNSNITASNQNSRVSLNANETITHSGNIETDNSNIEFIAGHGITLNIGSNTSSIDSNLYFDANRDIIQNSILETDNGDIHFIAGRNIVLNTGSSITTINGNITLSAPTTLGGDLTLTGGTVTFENTLDGTTAGQESLTIAGDAVFNRQVGRTTSLENLTINGTTAINGGSITIIGYQTYQGAVTFTLPDGSSFSATFDLASLDGTNGFRLDGIDADDESGHSVNTAGDVNGDGFDDVIISAFLADPGGNNKVLKI